MVKTIFFAAVAAFAMVASTVMADNTIPLTRMQEGENIPDAVQAFLKTPVGKSFTSEQVMKALKAPQFRQAKKAAEETVIISEDFSKWTAGSEDAPDDVNLGENQELLNSLTNQSGWTAFLTYQAGGMAYEGYDEVGDDGPGYLMTPDFDMSETQGILKFSARVKNVNPNAEGYGLQYFVLDNNPDQKGMMSAESLPMGDDWTEIEFIATSSSAYTSIMFFSWMGKVLIDNVTVESLTYPLDIPSGIEFSVVDGGHIEVSWDAVDKATSYEVAVYSTSYEEENLLTTTETSNTSIVIEAEFDPTQQIVIRVTAKNGEDESYPGFASGELSVDKVDTPVATDATNITENGFTANWEESANAANYSLYLTYTHEATEDGETLVYFDDDFSTIPYDSDDLESTIMTEDGSPVSLDDIFKYPGWSTYLASGFTGSFCITNMYESYGIPGVLIGPESNYSLGGGKAQVSITASTMVDDAIVMVGFAKQNGYSFEFKNGAQEFEISTQGSSLSAEITGGEDGDIILFYITDAAESGDMIMFTGINITTTLNKGEKYTSHYATVTLPYDETSYDVEAPFTGNDIFQYYVVGSFGETKSESSNVVTVYAPTFNSISDTYTNGNEVRVSTSEEGIAISNPGKAEVTVYTIDGRQVSGTSTAESITIPVKAEAYIIRAGNKSVKIVK